MGAPVFQLSLALVTALLASSALAQPIEIATPEQFDAIRNNLSGEYVLVADIDLATTSTSLGWLPIGTDDEPFLGVLDGNGHTIRNLVINRPTESRLGLFGVAGPGSRLFDLSLETATVTGGDNARIGSMVGHLNGGTMYEIGVLACEVRGGSGSEVGGLVGRYENSSELSNASAAGHATGGERSTVGLLVGRARRVSAIAHSSASGSATGGFYAIVGGLVGHCEETALMGTAASVVATGADDSTVGGLVGFSEVLSSITDSHASGNVTTGLSGHVGGLAGYCAHNSTIFSSRASGSVIGGSYSRVGGLAGYCYYYSTITNSHATGDVAGGIAARVGGLGGYCGISSTTTSSYATGNVKGEMSAHVGGLAGWTSFSSPVSLSYWDIELSGASSSDGGPGAMPRSTDEMTFPFAESTYTDWDFTAIWETGGEDYLNNGYPFHRWETRRLTITYEAAQGGAINGPATQIRIPGAGTAAVTAVPPSGFQFREWSDGRTDNPRVDRNVTSDMTITALFAPTSSQWILY